MFRLYLAGGSLSDLSTSISVDQSCFRWTQILVFIRRPFVSYTPQSLFL